MTLEIVTPSKKLISRNDVTSLSAPGVCGDFGVLEKHASMVTALGDGVIKYKADKEYSVSIQGGFFEVLDNKVIILASYAEVIE